MSDAKHLQPTEPPRRNFLASALAVVVGGIVSLFPLGVGLAVYLDPLMRRKSKAEGSGSGGGEEEYLPITTLSAIPDTPQAFPVIADRVNAWTMTPSERVGAVYLRRVDGQVEALHSICPHLGCFVSHDSENEQFYCPCHASSFNLDGTKIEQEGLENPSPRPMDQLDVKVEGDQVLVRFVNFKTGIHEKEEK